MTLHELADALLEIRRYVRSHPEHVRERLEGTDVCGFGLIKGVSVETMGRLTNNLIAGLRCIVVDPEILEGYLYGAAAEIREMALKQENAG